MASRMARESTAISRHRNAGVGWQLRECRPDAVDHPLASLILRPCHTA